MSGIEIAVLVTTVVAAGMGAYSSYAQGQAGAKQAEEQATYASGMAEYNRKLAERDAETARRKAEFEEGQFRKKARRLHATQRAGYSKSGVTYEGSPLLAMEESVTEAELDALAIRYGGAIEAQGYMGEAGLWGMKGAQARALGESQASQMRTAGYYGMATSLLKGAGQVGSIYGQGGSKKDTKKKS